MQIEGAAAEREALIEVLLTLGRLRRTGILTIQGDSEIIGLSFSDGQIVSADALNESLEEGLGEVLASQELVDPDAFASLVAEYEAGGGRVADLLVERNFVDRQQLLEALRLHHYILCRRALSWRQCEYKFYPGPEVTQEEGVRPLPVEELLVRAADDLGADGPLPGVMPPAEAVYERTELGDVAPGRDELLIGLATGDTDGAAGLLKEIDGRSSAADLARKTGVSGFEARLTLYLLERAGQVKEVDRDTTELVPDLEPEEAFEVAAAPEPVAPAAQEWPARPQRARSWLERFDLSDLDWRPWPARILGLILTGVLIWAMFTEPSQLLLPFPWQQGLRQAVLDEQTSAAYLKIDRGAKTSFLLDGHFPETLEGLVQVAYLIPRDLVDPAGRRLGYAAQVAGYLIYPLDEGEPAPGASRTEAITGNFLLDPEFVPSRAVEEPPLVLLD